MASESREHFTSGFPAQLSTVLWKHFAKHQWRLLVTKKINPIATLWANHFRKILRKVNTGKTLPHLHPIPFSFKRNFSERLKSAPMFNVSGNIPGLKFRSQTNLFLFFLFFPKCLLTVRAEDRLLGQTDPGSEPAQPFLHSLQYVSCTTLSQAVQKLFALSFFWLYEVYYLGNYTRNCTKQMVSSPIDARQVSRLTIIPLPCYTNNINLTDGYFAWSLIENSPEKIQLSLSPFFPKPKLLWKQTKSNSFVEQTMTALLSKAPR